MVNKSEFVLLIQELGITGFTKLLWHLNFAFTKSRIWSVHFDPVI